MLQSVDWQVLAAAVATFIVTGYVTMKGWLDKKKESQKPVELAGGIIQDNMTMRENTVATDELKEAVCELKVEMSHKRDDIKANTAALTRLTDLLLMQPRR